jgi:homoserine O-acetyltransferase
MLTLARKFEVEFGAILLSTPEYYNAHTTRQQAMDALANFAKSTEGYDANNKIRQVQAMMALDVSGPFGGSMEKAASAVRAKALVITSKYDQTVTPQPALDFAKLIHAMVVELDNDCGHNAPGCSETEVAKAISDFMSH